MTASSYPTPSEKKLSSVICHPKASGTATNYLHHKHLQKETCKKERRETTFLSFLPFV
jgi:hypothetical protein